MFTIDNPRSYNLIIKESPIHGLGVFTIIARYWGEPIAIYAGKKMLRSEFTDTDFTYTRVYGKHIYIAKPPKRNVLTYINDGGESANVEMRGLTLFAIKDIQAGDELFLSYNGPWRTL